MEFSWSDIQSANCHLDYPDLDAAGDCSSNLETIAEHDAFSYYHASGQLPSTQAQSDGVALETDVRLEALSEPSLSQNPHGITFDAVTSWNSSEEDFGTVDYHDLTPQPQSQGVHLIDANFRQRAETGLRTQEEGSFHNNLAGPFDELSEMPLSPPTPTQDTLPDTSTSILAPTPSRSPPSTNREHQADRTMMGSMYSTNQPGVYIFECTEPRCYNRTFGRWYDFKRHHDSEHAERRTKFWCRVPECNRSMAAGGRPFPRKDKMRDHVRKVHEG